MLWEAARIAFYQSGPMRHLAVSTALLALVLSTSGGPLHAQEAQQLDTLKQQIESGKANEARIAGEIAAATRPGGQAIFSGLLETDCERALDALRTAGLRLEGVRHLVDAGGEKWAGLLMMPLLLSVWNDQASWPVARSRARSLPSALPR